MKRGIIVFVEGETEEEIYNIFIRYIHSIANNGKFSTDKLLVRNLKGISNFRSKAIRVFSKEILPQNPNFEFDIFLCYDTDVFDFSQKPPVDWKEVEKDLKNLGAKKVIHIKAKHSIEDWILNDFDGICRYLKISSTTNNISGSGFKKLESLFKKSNKVYIKGSKAKGFIESLSIQKIMCTNCTQVKNLCRLLGVTCPKQK